MTPTVAPVTLDPEMARKLSRAGNKVGRWTEIRDELIREAVDAGGSLREVAEAVGLSHMGVKNIARGRSKPAQKRPRELGR